MVNRIYGGVIAPQEPVRSGQQTRQSGDFHAALQQELQRVRLPDFLFLLQLRHMLYH